MTPMRLSRGKYTLAGSNPPATRDVQEHAGLLFYVRPRHGGTLSPMGLQKRRLLPSAGSARPAIAACLKLSSAPEMIAVGPAVILRKKRVTFDDCRTHCWSRPGAARPW